MNRKSRDRRRARQDKQARRLLGMDVLGKKKPQQPSRRLGLESDRCANPAKRPWQAESR